MLLDIYLMVSALFMAGWFARRVPMWIDRAYKKDVARHGRRDNVIQYVHEIFCEN